jgi:type IX secretion system PorP/SprF family membrane protein
MKLRLIKYIVLFLIGVNLATAQDAHFSQYYASSLYLNPALAGAPTNATFSSNYRTQWRSIVIPYTTSQMSLIMPLVKKDIKETHYAGAGISFYNDKAGDGNFKTSGVAGTFSYNLPLAKKNFQYLSFGLQGGIMQKNLDYTNGQWDEQYNEFIGFDGTIQPTDIVLTNKFLVDLNAGFMYYYNPERNYLKSRVSTFFGGSVYHISSPNESLVPDTESRLPRVYKGMGGVEFLFGKKFSITPTFLYMMQGVNQQTNLGVYVNYNFREDKKGLLTHADFIMGGWYRVGDAAIIMTGIETDHYTIGLSYDMNASSLRNTARGVGAYEISLTVRRIKEKRLKKFSTPRI